MLSYKCELTISKIENGRFSVSIDNLEKLLDKINSTLEILDILLTSSSVNLVINVLLIFKF